MRYTFLVGFSFVIAFLFPSNAFAVGSGYSIDELSTELHVDADGAVHVVEHQIVTFEDRNEGYIWYLHAPEQDESVKINVIRTVPVDNGGALTGEWTKLQMIDVDVARQGASPGDTASYALRMRQVQPWYSYSISDGMVRSYFPAESGAYLIESDYTVSNRILVYRDVAELYWRYAQDSLPVEAHDVTLQVSLPAPFEEGADRSQDILAWGHGPNNGSFAIGENGTVVYHVDWLERGTYAEAHILFPAYWMTSMRENAPRLYSELHMQDAIAAESEWVDSYSRGANWDYEVRVLFLGIAAVMIFIGVVCLALFGRTYRSRRALIRVACALGIVALATNLFFKEPLTVVMLLAVALIVLVVALCLPQLESDAERVSPLPDNSVPRGSGVGS